MSSTRRRESGSGPSDAVDAAEWWIYSIATGTSFSTRWGASRPAVVNIDIAGSVSSGGGDMSDEHTIYFDGSCDPNPGGIAGVGVYSSTLFIRVSQRFGEGDDMTNNVAEYAALCEALERAMGMAVEGDTVHIRGDSNLVVKQVNGDWRVKSDHLVPFHRRALELLDELQDCGISVDIGWVSRKDNKVADALSYEATRET